MGGDTCMWPRILAPRVIGDADDGLARKWLNLRSRRAEKVNFRVWRSPVAHRVWGARAEGSNPFILTLI